MSCLLALGALTSSAACTTEKVVQVPVTPKPCIIPSFYAQKPCHADIPCLLTQFALSLQAQDQVAAALKACPNVQVEAPALPALMTLL